MRFQPYLNAAIALGGSTSEKNYGLVAGGHAPLDDGFNLQAIELGGLLEIGPRFAMRASGNVLWDRFDGWDSEWEEVFGQFELAGEWRLRAGQFLVPFGYENTLHLHDRAFVEPPVSVVRLLGEEGLYTRGAELVAPLGGGIRLQFGMGQGRHHSHEDGEREARQEAWFEAQEEGEHGDEDEEDEHEEDEHHHHHGLAGGGGVYDPDSGYLEDLFGHVRLEGEFGSDREWLAGCSSAFGENAGGLDTWLLGADLLQRFELADRPAWWRAEAFYGRFEARDDEGRAGDYDQSGVYAAIGCEFIEDWTAAARAEWASGNRLAGLERRWRLSAAVSRLFSFPPVGDAHLRLQYSYDHLGGYGDDHAVWLQCVLNLGAAHHGHTH